MICRTITLGAVAVAALSIGRAQVQPSLVCADQTVEAGHAVVVALHLVQQPHWHTYWLNPGTGLPTTLKWTLPAGWKAGAIQWPAPAVLMDTTGTVTGNGYEGDLLLPVTLTPPPGLNPGSVVVLTAKAEWLMCQDVCMPGNATLRLRLQATAHAPQPDPIWGPRIQAVLDRLPRADPGWQLSASRTDKNVTLRLTVGPDGLNPAPHELHFFSEDNLVAYDQPQGIVADGRAGYVFTLPLSPDGPTGATRLLGVITAVNGWRADGTLPGLKVDIPFGLHASTVANPVSATALPPSTGPANGGPTPLPPGGSGLGGTLILAFLGGLILNLMPCVFPVLGIKVLGFVNQAGAVRSKVVAHGVVFSAGVILSFWALAGVLAILRQGGNSLGWGFQLQSPGFIYLLAAVMLAFALNLSGVFEFGLSATGIGGSLQSRGGYVGSFLTGVLATIVATPCSAPFLAPALGAALALSFASAFAVFTAIAIGLSTPYLLLSIFPAAVRVLPRPGAWMETFRQLMAFPLYASVAYLAWVLAGQLQENALMNALFGLVLIALAVWIYGRCSAPGSSVFSARFGMIAGALVLALGAWNGWPVPPAPTDIVWQKWSPETVARLRGAGRIVYVDFTARWCATCQANKRVVFHSPEVLKEFRAKHIATLRGDWTNRDAQVTGELAKYHRSAVPFNEVWVPGRPTPIVLPEILTPGVVLRAVGGS